jgi:hypothetical protein
MKRRFPSRRGSCGLGKKGRSGIGYPGLFIYKPEPLSSAPKTESAREFLQVLARDAPTYTFPAKPVRCVPGVPHFAQAVIGF